MSSSATPLSILVVEDNQDSARSLAMFLQLCGHEVHTAHDGHAALQAAALHRPQVVLLDIGLPGLDGYEVSRRLRALPEFAQLRVVALTGYGQQEDRRRAHVAGMNHYFVKPVDPEVLLDYLARPTAYPSLEVEFSSP